MLEWREGATWDEATTYLTQMQTMSEFLDGQIDEVPEEKFHQRPGPGLNPVSWNYFPMLRIWDVDINWHCNRQEPEADAWHRAGFSEKSGYEPFGKGGREMGLGFGYTDQEVDGLTVSAAVLREYHHQLLMETTEYLKTVDEAELHQPIQRFDQPPRTAAERIQHTIAHCWNHIGEMRYAKGMLGMSDPSYPGE